MPYRDDIRLPQSETFYQVAGVFGANNEPADHWETVGSPRHLKEDAEKEREQWENQFPDRPWIVLRAITTWERIA